MADFQFYLNRQGPRGAKGPQGEKGDAGLTYVPRTGTNTPTETTVIFETTDGQSYETPNLKYPIEDRGGNYLRLDRDENTQYYGNPNYADLSHNPGEVILLNANDFSHGDPEELEGYAVSGQFITSALNKINDDFTDVNNAIALKADQATTYTKTETNTLLNGKANTVHTHTLSQITDAGSLAGKNTVNYNIEVTNKPTIGNGTITITQGGVTKGTFTTNQSGNTPIALDVGGGGSPYTAGDGINISSDTISVKVDESTIDFDANGKLKVIGSVAPSNMVTTDTSQTITGSKTFENIALASGYSMNLGGNVYTYLRENGLGLKGDAGCEIELRSYYGLASIGLSGANDLYINNTGLGSGKIYVDGSSDFLLQKSMLDNSSIVYNTTTNKVLAIPYAYLPVTSSGFAITGGASYDIDTKILYTQKQSYENPCGLSWELPSTLDPFNDILELRVEVHFPDYDGDDSGVFGFCNTLLAQSNNDAYTIYIDRYYGGRLFNWDGTNYNSSDTYYGLDGSNTTFYLELKTNGDGTATLTNYDSAWTTPNNPIVRSLTTNGYITPEIKYISLGSTTRVNGTTSAKAEFNLDNCFYRFSNNGTWNKLPSPISFERKNVEVLSKYFTLNGDGALTLDIKAIKDAIDNL